MFTHIKRARSVVFIVVLALAIGASSLYTDGWAVYAADSDTVTLSANGGKGLKTKSMSIPVGSKYGVMPEPYRIGYLFDGWYTAKYEGTMITPKTVRTAETPAKLYAHWAEASTKVNLVIKKWNIKSKITVAYDLSLMAKTQTLLKLSGKKKYAISMYGAYWVRYYASGGISDTLHAKVGTAKLAEPAPENILTDINVGLPDREAEQYWLVCYKGSKTADVYIGFNIKLLNKGKEIDFDGAYYSGTVDKGIPKKFKYGKKYKTASKSSVVFVNGVTPNYAEKGITSKKQKLQQIGAEAYWTYDGKTYLSYMDKPVVYYKNKYTKKSLGIWGVPFSKNVKVKIQNKKLAFSGSIDTKNPIYKQAKKLIGKYSPSCYGTVQEIKDKVKGGEPVFNLPPNQAKTGDITWEPDHTAIYIGGGKTINGTGSGHKVFLSNHVVRDSAYIRRPIANVFRYR